MKKLILAMGCLILLTGLLLQTVHAAGKQAVLKIGATEEPDSLSPVVAYERGAFELFMLVYDSLVCFDENLNPVPSLAEKWEISDDKLSWTFHLRKDVKWHDGQPFTSRDVKYTYETIKESGLGMYADLVKDIDVIETPDEHTVVLKTATPKANMLQNITPILPQHIWQEIGPEELETFENASPVGTGPFILQEWKKNEYVSLLKNGEYFKGAPKVDGLIFTIFANRDTMAQSLKRGEIDVALGLYKNQAKTIQDNPQIKVYEFRENGFTELAFNCWEDPASRANPLIKDKIVRQAIELAIDKQKIIDMVFEGAGACGTTLIPASQQLYHYEPAEAEIRTFAPQKAKALLEAAGYGDEDGDGIRESKDGKGKLQFTFLLRSENTLEVKAGQMIKGYLQDIGIGTTLETIDDGALNDRIFNTHDYDMFIWGWGGDVDPGTLLRVLTTGQLGNLNDAYYSNPAYDRLVLEQASKLDYEERKQLVWEAQKILYEDLPYIILFYGTELQLVREDQVSGLQPTISGAVFYADTPLNYVQAEMAGTAAEAAEPDAAARGPQSPAPLYILGAAVLLAVIGLAARKRGKSREEW